MILYYLYYTVLHCAMLGKHASPGRLVFLEEGDLDDLPVHVLVPLPVCQVLSSLSA